MENLKKLYDSLIKIAWNAELKKDQGFIITVYENNTDEGLKGYTNLRGEGPGVIFALAGIMATVFDMISVNQHDEETAKNIVDYWLNVFCDEVRDNVKNMSIRDAEVKQDG